MAIARTTAIALTALLPVSLAAAVGRAAQHPDGVLTIAAVDAKSQQPIAARIELRTSRGRPVSLRLPGTAQLGGHFYVDGRLTLPLRIGQYEFDLDAGPEYRTQTGHFEIQRHADDTKTVEMHRVVNMAKEGWWAGDLDVTRPLADLPLAMRAEGLSVVPDTAWQNVDGKWSENDVEGSRRLAPAGQPAFGPWAMLDQRPGGGLLLFDLPTPPDGLRNATRYAPSSREVARAARAAGGHVVARTPLAWDLPVWLAGDVLDAIDVINPHSLADGVVDNEGAGRPRDKVLFPGATGNGRWSEAIYYHVLECGLRIPPAAGSGCGSGTNDSPVGTNRAYVYCGDDFSYERWWDGLEAGRVVVTNGPLLRPLVEGQPPGYVFHLAEGRTLSLQVGLNLATRTPIDYLEIVKNGRAVAEVRLDRLAKSHGRLPPVLFDDSGWLVVRAVTGDRRRYQFAASGPYYVEKSGQPRISRTSVRFFLDWIDAAEARLGKLPDLDAADRQRLLAEQETARRFFADLLSRANAD
jgi:hypothetical protein